jgi:hypothetical protein
MLTAVVWMLLLWAVSGFLAVGDFASRWKLRLFETVSLLFLLYIVVLMTLGINGLID